LNNVGTLTRIQAQKQNSMLIKPKVKRIEVSETSRITSDKAIAYLNIETAVLKFNHKSFSERERFILGLI